MRLHKLPLTGLILLVILALLSPANAPTVKALQPEGNTSYQTTSGPTVCVLDTPVTSSYPDVQLSFRMFDAAFLPVTNLTDQQIRISENGNPAVPLNSNLQTNDARGGIDYYFVLDRSNRTDSLVVKGILQEFLGHYQADVDTVTLYTDSNNAMVQYYPNSNFKSLSQAVTNYPESSEDNMRTIHTALDSLATQFINTDYCARPKVVYFILGDGAFSPNWSGQFIEITKTAKAKTALLHVPNPRGASYQSRALYESSIQNAKGVYRQIVEAREDSRFIFDQVAPYRKVYTASYQTNNGASGTHTIQVEYLGTNVTTAGLTTYNINLLPPKVTLSAETIVTRNAVEKIDGGFSYDKDSQDVTLTVDWPDGYSRELAAGATLIVSGQTSEPLRIPISLSNTGGNMYKFSWNFATLQERGQYDMVLSVEVKDEFGLTSTSESGIQITILNKVSPSVYFKAFNWLIYAMAALVVILLVAIILLWKKIGNLAVKGGQALGKVAGEIRKTLVGGGRRGKPLATLKIVDGPASMVGEELKIFTEKVSLGRDPKVSDLTFFAPDANSSVSGLHAILERVSGSWRLVAVSQSGSETFVDNNAIPFNDPVFINPGQQVRLGYVAQQPVVFEFQTQSSAPRTTDVRKTDVGDKTTPIGLIKVDKNKEQELKKDASKEKESLFDEYLD